MKKSIIGFALFAAHLLAPFAVAQQVTPVAVPSHAPASPAVLARVNGVALTESDLREQMERLFPFYSFHGGQVPKQAEPEIRQKAFERMVLEELLYQEATRRKLQIPAEELAKRVAKVRRQYPSAAAYNQTISARFGSQQEFKKRIRRAYLIETLWKQQVVSTSRVTQAEVRRYYEVNKSKYVRPESVWLQTISFQFAERATESEKKRARSRAEEILPQARAAASLEAFGKLAERYSMDDWRVMNGDHGWVHRGTLGPELEQAFRMKPGEVSDIIPSREGFHILRVNGHRPESQMEYAAARATVRKTLENERLQKRQAEYEAELRRSAKIEKP